MASDDLFDDEAGMVRMTFGEHLEDLRRRLILALLGFVPGVIIGLMIGRPILQTMAEPAAMALENFYKKKDARDAKRIAEAREKQLYIETKPVVLEIRASEFRRAMAQAQTGELTHLKTDYRTEQEPEKVPGPGSGEAAPAADSPDDRDSLLQLTVYIAGDELQIVLSRTLSRMRMITLRPDEMFIAYLKVSIVAGLVLSSWWVIYQLWQFVAEGLYKHERHVIYRAMPVSVGLFLGGVAFCFYIVLPVVLNFFFSFNEWFDIEPNLRLSEWLSFATIVPVIFGVCFELPLVMAVLDRVGIFGLDDYVNKWRHAILIIAIVAMIVTPTTDPSSMMLLMGPLSGLYFLGIGLVYLRAAKEGKVPPLTGTVKVRITAGVVAAAYLIVIGSLFVLPARWLPGDWFEQIWWHATLPTIYLVEWARPVTRTDVGWIWGVTLVNAFLLGMLILRVGELGIWLLGRGRTERT